MHFKVAKSDLEDALQTVAGSLANSGGDISSHYTFRETNKDGVVGVEVLTQSGRVFSSSPLKAVHSIAAGTGPKDKAFTVEGWRLKGWLQNVAAATAPEFVLDGGVVTVKVPQGKQTFQSLDPSQFPYWDKLFNDSVVKATLPANRLQAALAYARNFASDQEAKNPETCVCEVRDGILCATDKKAVALIRVPGLEKSNLRVHVKDVGGFLTFLATAGDGDVEILEHDRVSIVRRIVDGAMFGESRFSHSYPAVNLSMDDASPHTWDIPRSDLQKSIGFLVAGAVKDDNRLRFSESTEDGVVNLSMDNTSGTKTTLALSGVITDSTSTAVALPDEGFLLDWIYLGRILNLFKEEVVQFGITPLKTRGLVKFEYTHLECKFVTILPWLQSA